MADEIEIDDAALEALLAGDDEDDTGDGKAAGNEPPSDWKPPTYAEWKAAQDKVTAANGNARNLRLKFKEYRDQHGPKPAPPKTGASAGGNGDQGKTEAQIRAELDAEYKAKQAAQTVQTEAVTALVAAGLQLPEDAKRRSAAARRAIKLLDLDGVDPGDADGIAAAIEDLKSDHPGLFAASAKDDEDTTKTKRRRVGGPSGRAPQGDGKALSNNEQLARALLKSGALRQG
jgi:hypothetical protein